MRRVLRCLLGTKLGPVRTAGRLGQLLYVALLAVLATAVYLGLRTLQVG